MEAASFRFKFGLDAEDATGEGDGLADTATDEVVEEGV